MAEKHGFGEDRNKTIVRTPRPEVKVTRWDWDSNKEKDTFDLSPYLLNMSWQKTIKSPNGGLTVTCIAQTGRTHFLDFLKPMDVIKVYEFGTLKFHGYIRSVDSVGKIDPQLGKPDRKVSIKAMSFGNLLMDGQLGLNVYLARGDEALANSTEGFAAKLADIINDETSTFASVIESIVDEWLKHLKKLGAEKYATYISRFLDYSTGTDGKAVPGYPRQIRLFRIETERMSLWEMIQKVCEPPFNEVWFDNGPRKVNIETSASLSGTMKSVDLPSSESDEKTYLIVRSTPFNGTVVNGSETALWDDMPVRTIPLGYLTQFSLSKSMEESYSFYLVEPVSSVSFSELQLVAQSAFVFDNTAFDKYLYRPLTQKKFFSRSFDEEETKIADKAQSVIDVSVDDAQTLRNWFQHNDEYLSGTFTIMVPSNPDHDPKIGDKIEFEGLEGNFFYVEGISRSWNYGGPMTATLSVTRGYGRGKPIELNDKIFKRGIFAMNRKFQ